MEIHTTYGSAGGEQLQMRRSCVWIRTQECLGNSLIRILWSGEVLKDNTGLDAYYLWSYDNELGAVVPRDKLVQDV